MAENKPDCCETNVSFRPADLKGLTHENQHILDFIFPTFALLFIFLHPQLSHCRPVLSIMIYFVPCGLSLGTPLRSRVIILEQVLAGAL